MHDLDVIDLYNNADTNRINSFNKGLNSSLNIKTDYDKVVCDFEWVDMMEDTIMHLDSILRNPNRFIINEEEIVKVELARRITVDSIKHLSRNTNLIQDIDKKTGDVKPSKILNINKDESFNTYENRFIYTLITNMKNFIALKKQNLNVESSLKDLKSIDYKAATSVGTEKVNISINVNSSKMQRMNDGVKNGKGIPERIEKLEMQLNDLSNSEVYKSIAKLHIALVMSPIKKTNVILKNSHFQEAVKLWNYLQSHIQTDDKREKENKNYADNGELKKYIDNNSLLNYLALNLLDKEENGEKLDPQSTEEVTNALIDKIVTLNDEVDIQKLQEIIGTKIMISKQKNVASLKEIQEIFNKNINSYLKRIESFEL